jgi:REP element-mobilizing transposase RayT
MSTYTQILYQIVFGSKNGLPFLNQQNQDKLFNYIAGIANNKKSIPYKIGGHLNHLHLIIYLHPSQSLSDFVREIKRSSHNWMLDQKANFRTFPGWQVGYGGFTYNYKSKKDLIRYVENQAEHHKRVNFQDELIKLLNDYGIEFDEKYLLI